jgi:uncharacterized coiled-coil protein SlyX
MHPALGSCIGTCYAREPISKLRDVGGAVFCAALVLPAAIWGADDSEAVAPATTRVAGQSTEIERLKTQLEFQQRKMEEQQRQIRDLQTALEEQKTALAEQKKLINKVATLEAALPSPPPEPEHPEHKVANLGDVASTVPYIPKGVASVLPPIAAAPQIFPPRGTLGDVIPDSPLQIRLGDTAITPVAFMDATETYRSTASGADLATNFGNYPYNNNLPLGRLTESRFSLQNSRIGVRVDSLFKGYHVLGYWESDFVGGVGDQAFNTQVTSYSMILRLRLFWVDIRKGKYEFLAGQSWSLLTPNRRQISALPGDIFYGLVFDVNYINGLVWGRIPGYRFVYHPSAKVTWAIAAENTSQYFGGSGGEGLPTLPAALGGSSSATFNLTNSELDASVANGLKISNYHPDVISKIAFDPNARVHFEIAGVWNGVKIFNPNPPPALGSYQYFTKSGGGGAVNGNFEVVRNLRLITNNFWSDGAGRYIYGEAPNFILRANGDPSLIHSGSTVDGFEWTYGKAVFYAYYGGIFVGRNTALDANGTTLIGYGYRGSPNSQNRTMQEITGGWNQTFYRDPKYGQVSTFLQYSYFWRNPWFVAPGAPKNAFQNAVWFDVRYTLPGSAPAVGY